MRAMSERVVLRTNIFFEQPPKQQLPPLPTGDQGEDDGQHVEEYVEERMLEEGEDPNLIGSGLGDDYEDDNDMDEVAFKEALERAKAAAEKLSMRPTSKK